MRRLRMTCFAGYAVLLLSVMLFDTGCVRTLAQGMSPVSQDFNKKARGTVAVTNVGDSAKIVSCRAQSFTADEHGTLELHPLDAALHVRIDAERVVLAAQSSRQVSFDANPATVPAWFVVTCRFTPMERKPGLTVAMEVSSIVIIHGGRLDQRDVTLKAKHVGDKVEVEIRNNGSGLARVISGEVVGHRKQVDLGTFVLFPHQRRLVEKDWKETAPPETARIRIDRKRLETPVE